MRIFHLMAHHANLKQVLEWHMFQNGTQHTYVWLLHMIVQLIHVYTVYIAHSKIFKTPLGRLSTVIVVLLRSFHGVPPGYLQHSGPITEWGNIAWFGNIMADLGNMKFKTMLQCITMIQMINFLFFSFER